MTYVFKFRRRFHLFYRRFKVVGNAFSQDLDRMTLFLPNGGIHEVHKWSECDCKLGPDWVLAKQKDMEKQAGKPIPIDRDLNAK